MAQGQGAGSRRGGLESGARALNSAASLTAGAAAILAAADPAAKTALSGDLARAWRAGLMPLGATCPPNRPARPPRPLLCPPRAMPKRRAFGSARGRGALIHALAHIELNAIDLAWDIVARFATPSLPRAFFDDWVGVAAEEAEHFALLAGRLGQLGMRYGDLPAHDGLWEAAAATADDLLARLAVVPLVFEARGLDVTPPMRDRLLRAGDPESAALLDRLYRDEIGHVAVGRRWFEAVCEARGLASVASFHDLVRRRLKGGLKPPFNHAARAAAGFPAAYYAPLAAGED
ncbi:MAG: ferritin-like domain-containing protein [Stellaceae bacterium]